MIQYTSNDIINRAEQIADLEDSSFISWNENIAMLNEAYSSFYQKVIDKDEGYFVKDVELSVGENELPSDFYQIKYVGLISGQCNMPILRRPKSDSFVDMSYDVVGNNIYINGVGLSGKIILQYYTVPPTLTFPNEDYDNTAVDTTKTLKDANKNLYLYSDGLVVNSKTSTTKQLPSVSTSVYPYNFVFENGAFGTYEQTISGGRNYMYMYSLFGNSSPSNITKLYIVNNKIETSFDTAGFTKIGTGIVGYVVGNYIFNVKLDSGNYFVNDTIQYTSIKFTDDAIYLIDKNNCFCVYDLEFNLLKKTEPGNYKFINDINFDTGYGITCYDTWEDKWYVTSFCDNTELNFSNTFFFPVIAYNLARSYKIKQGADFSAINVKYEEVLQQFFDSLSVDSNNCTRITNVY